MSSSEIPRLLCDTGELIANSAGNAGALWRLSEPGRQLDSNVVRLPPGERVDTHAEPDLDVMLLVLSGRGTLTTDEGDHNLTPGTLLWLPRTSRRSLAADADADGASGGLCYLTVHRRRPGMRIRRPWPSVS